MSGRSNPVYIPIFSKAKIVLVIKYLIFYEKSAILSHGAKNNRFICKIIKVQYRLHGKGEVPQDI